jgi:hypothetical protein
MDDGRLEMLVAAVRERQGQPLVRPLRCGNDATHRPLEPLVTNGRVILQCPDCPYCQDYIPSSVLHAFSNHLFEPT